MPSPRLSLRRLLTALLLLALLLPDGAAAAHRSTQADRAMSAGMATMDRNMAQAPMTGDPDHDFVAMMEPHHQGAIDMARVELRYGSDPTLRKLAKEIVTAQEQEIATMRRWQASHHAPSGKTPNMASGM